MGQRGVAAETVEDSREFAGDEAAADDQHPARQVLHQEQIVRDQAQFLARNAGALRPPADRDQDVLGRQALAVRQFDRMGVGQPGPRPGIQAQPGQDGVALVVTRMTVTGELDTDPVSPEPVHQIGQRSGCVTGERRQPAERLAGPVDEAKKERKKD